MQPLHRAGRSCAHIVAEHDRAPGTGRRELDRAVIVAGGIVDVEPPTEIVTETLGAIGVRDGDDDDFEFHVVAAGSRSAASRIATSCSTVPPLRRHPRPTGPRG